MNYRLLATFHMNGGTLAYDVKIVEDAPPPAARDRPVRYIVLNGNDHATFDTFAEALDHAILKGGWRGFVITQDTVHSGEAL